MGSNGNRKPPLVADRRASPTRRPGGGGNGGGGNGGGQKNGAKRKRRAPRRGNLLTRVIGGVFGFFWRVIWGVTEGAIAAVLLVAGGEAALEALQTASLVSGLPFSLILLLVCYNLYRALSREFRVQGVEPQEPAGRAETRA